MTLGQVLKSKRLELGKSVEQIATATRIHVKVLKALEEDHYSDLPARAFTRGFIVAYCKALQLDSDQFLRDYHDFLESKFAERPEKDHGHHGYAFESKETEQNKRWMIISASVAAFFAILTLLFFKPQNHKHKEKHKELIAEEAEITTETAALNPAATPSVTPEVTISTATATPTPSTVAVATVSATPAASSTPVATPITTPTPTVAIASPTPTPIAAVASPTPKEDPLSKGDDLLQKDAKIKIVILAVEDTLIHYHSDQRKPFSIMLRKDKQLVIKAMDLIRVETASPERLKYKLNFKNKATSGEYLEFKQERLELRPDGTENTFNAGAL